MALLAKVGYGQVEPNRLTGLDTHALFASLPVVNTIAVVEQGMFLKYDQANDEVNLTGAGEWKLAYSEVKIYDRARKGYKDFALLASNAVDGEILPRLVKTQEGDAFTTNLVDDGAGPGPAVTLVASGIVKGDLLTVDPTTGILTKTAPSATGQMVWQVVKLTTMPDGQEAVKVTRVDNHVA